MIDPATNVQYLKGVGPDRARILGGLGILTVEDLARHLPRTHQDRRQITRIGDLEAETRATIRGRVQAVHGRRLGRGRGAKSVVTAEVDDGTGIVGVEFWNQRFRQRQLGDGPQVIVSGRVTWDLTGPRMKSPELEVLVADDPTRLIHAGRLVPVHPVTRGLSTTVVRIFVWRALEAVADHVVDPIPEATRLARGFPPLGWALRQVQFPDTEENLTLCLRRLKYEELFLFQAALALKRMRYRRETKPHRVRIDPRVDERIRARVPFTLTGAQERVLGEIRDDLASPYPMNRLLQGDVGSGKTVVAVYAMLCAVAARLQAALLAPTEILAEQHHRNLSRMLEGSKVRIGLLSGGSRESEKRAIRDAAALGDLDVLVGTHALLQQSVRFDRLALVVVDEQHKFGVLQRSTLRDKGISPDLLVMSATPIPRTLTMTLYGDLDVSVIDELPPGRQPVETAICRERDREAMYRWIRGELDKGRRAYHVVPLVEENEELPLTSAKELAEELAERVFPDHRVGLLHGKLPSREKERAMEAFRTGQTPVLVCTTVVEVGVDVPEATILVVEDAERFGLAQLHQLRGRIGRGDHASRMVLFCSARTKKARQRLKALRSTTDGFLIAEADLRIRGPGEFLGTKQSGVPELTIADLVEDGDLVAQAREDASALVERDPGLENEAAPLGECLLRQFGERFLQPGA